MRRVRNRFRIPIAQRRTALSSLQDDVDAGKVGLASCWNRFELEEAKCRGLFAECLAFMEGMLSRQVGLDAGLCQITDAMLDGLSHRADIKWDRFSILAEGEFVTEMADIIRLRFPEASVWNLPIAAHEFAHFLGPAVEVRQNGERHYPFQSGSAWNPKAPTLLTPSTPASSG